MTVSIIIPTADQNSPRTKACLQAVRATTKPSEVRIQVVESSGPGFRFSKSINQGIRAHPDASAWIMLNDDCIMEPGWLEAMLHEVRPGVGVVGALLQYPGGGVQHAGGYITTGLAYFLHCTFKDLAPFHAIRKLLRTPPDAIPYCYHHDSIKGQRIDFLTGACLLITREARQRVGLLDESYEFSFEDVDYCLRTKEAGLRLVLSRAKGTHEERATGGRLTEKIMRSEATFNHKWNRQRLQATRSQT